MESRQVVSFRGQCQSCPHFGSSDASAREYAGSWNRAPKIVLSVPKADCESRRSTPELLRVVEASRLMSLSRTKVYEMAERGKILVTRIGTAVRIPRRKMLLWIEQQTVSPKV